MARISLLTVLATAALIAGCGSSKSNSSTASRSAAASTASGPLSLSETEFKITPSALTAAKGGTITITVKNAGAITHALAVATPSGVVKTAPIAPGSSATLTVNASKPGSYAFYCPIANHRQLGMKGTLVVGGGGTASAPASGGAAVSGSSSNSPY